MKFATQVVRPTASKDALGALLCFLSRVGLSACPSTTTTRAVTKSTQSSAMFPISSSTPLLFHSVPCNPLCTLDKTDPQRGEGTLLSAVPLSSGMDTIELGFVDELVADTPRMLDGRRVSLNEPPLQVAPVML